MQGGHEEAGFTGKVPLKDSRAYDHVLAPAVQHWLIPLTGPLAFGISLTFACTSSSRYSSLSFRLQQSELLAQQPSPLVGMVACIIVQIFLE